MKNKFNISWRQKSLEVLENNKWPDQKDYPSGLVKRCHEFRKIPLDQLTTENLRTLIGQQIGLRFLIPIAIEILANDILAEGDFYPGDLLESVVRVDIKFWKENPKLKDQLIELYNAGQHKINYGQLNLKNLNALRGID